MYIFGYFTIVLLSEKKTGKQKHLKRVPATIFCTWHDCLVTQYFSIHKKSLQKKTTTNQTNSMSTLVGLVTCAEKSFRWCGCGRHIDTFVLNHSFIANHCNMYISI